MLTSIAGIYRNGRVELIDTPRHMKEDSQVIVTFQDEEGVDLQAYGIDKAKASELRARLASFAEDWNSPEMDIYDKSLLNLE